MRCRAEKHVCITGLVLLVVAMVALIEWRHPYYFLIGDNLDQNLPYYVHNLRALLGGELPLYNFHQFMGTPVFACIQSAALYPPHYAALLASKWLWGHYYGTFELLALFHLTVAAAGFFRLMRQFGLDESSSAWGAFTWVFCGFVMLVGRMWIQVIEYAALFPWLLLYGLRLSGRFDSRVFASLTLLRMLAFWAGNPSLFLYIATFDLLFAVTCRYAVCQPVGTTAVLVADHQQIGTVRVLLRHAGSYVLVAVLSLPLLLPALHQVSISADRSMPLAWEEYSKAGYRLSEWLYGSLLLFYKAQHRLNGQDFFYAYTGWLTLVFIVVALFCRKQHRKLSLVLFCLAGFALLWSCNTFVTRLVYHLPLFNRQRFPVKLLFFTSFFMIVMAALGHNRMIQAVRRRLGRTWPVAAVLLVVQAASLLAFLLYTPEYARRGKLVPYEEPLKSMLSDGRIVTIVARDADEQDKQPYLLGYNYATLFGLNHFAGYEILVSRDNGEAALMRNGSADFFVDNDRFDPNVEDLEHFRHWGVRWYVLDKRVQPPQSAMLKQLYRDSNRTILYDGEASPLVFWEDTTQGEGVAYDFTTNSIRLVTERQTAGELVVNVLHNPFFLATLDNDKIPLPRAADRRIRLNVPPGRHEIRIVYRDPYFIAGMYGTGAFLGLAALVTLAIARQRKKIIILKNASTNLVLH